MSIGGASPPTTDLTKFKAAIAPLGLGAARMPPVSEKNARTDDAGVFFYFALPVCGLAVFPLPLSVSNR